MTARPTLDLQTCADCGVVQYPSRPACQVCFGEALTLEPQSAAGKLLSWTRLHVSADAALAATLPIDVGILDLDCGVQLIAFLDGGPPVSGRRRWIVARADSLGRLLFHAAANPETNP